MFYVTRKIVKYLQSNLLEQLTLLIVVGSLHFLNSGSTPNVNACIGGAEATEKQTSSTTSGGGYGGMIVEKFHGFTEKLQAFGHHRSDSDTSVRARTGRFFNIIR